MTANEIFVMRMESLWMILVSMCLLYPMRISGNIIRDRNIPVILTPEDGEDYATKKDSVVEDDNHKNFKNVEEELLEQESISVKRLPAPGELENPPKKGRNEDEYEYYLEFVPKEKTTNKENHIKITGPVVFSEIFPFAQSDHQFRDLTINYKKSQKARENVSTESSFPPFLSNSEQYSSVNEIENPTNDYLITESPIRIVDPPNLAVIESIAPRYSSQYPLVPTSRRHRIRYKKKRRDRKRKKKKKKPFRGPKRRPKYRRLPKKFVKHSRDAKRRRTARKIAKTAGSILYFTTLMAFG